MSREVDLTLPGGFPLDEDVLDYLQQGNLEAIRALCLIVGDGPAILTGCVYSSDGTNEVLTDGWIVYKGDIYRVAGGSFLAASVPAGSLLGLNMATAATSLTYYDGSINPTALQEQYFNWGTVPDATLIANRFPLQAMHPFGEDAGEVDAIGAGDVELSGSISYKKNWLTNTLHIWGTATVGAAGSLAATGTGIGPRFYGLTNVGNYTPANDVPFTAYLLDTMHQIDDDQGAPLRQVTGMISSDDGELSICFVKPAAGVATYTVTFNIVIHLG